jgi:dienelactone hydrolase
VSKDNLLGLLGPFPDRVPLEADVVDSSDCGSYIRDKVEYNIESGERISAYVLIPKAVSGKVPAVFCHHQHAGNYEIGKSEVVGIAGDPNQAYAKELAERGYIVFAPDAIGFEERNRGDISGIGQYIELAKRIVEGETLLAKALHDISVGIDYLISRDDVDRQRIGFIGHSYGGRMAIWTPAFDERIKVSVSSCGCIPYRYSLTRDTGIQLEFCIPGIMQWGDIDDVVRLVEPSSLLIIAAGNDKWSRGAQAVYDYAKFAFKQGELKLKMFEGGHTFAKEMREVGYQFLDRSLSHSAQ